MNLADKEVSQIDIALFRKKDFRGENKSFQRFSGTDREFFVVMSNEQGIKALFRTSLMLNAVECQYVLDDKHTFVTKDDEAS